ncbi:MAG: hypothetical protein GY835_18520 [bacterium]|nr:hypothetical protein [bacterium]
MNPQAAKHQMIRVIDESGEVRVGQSRVFTAVNTQEAVRGAACASSRACLSASRRAMLSPTWALSADVCSAPSVVTAAGVTSFSNVRSRAFTTLQIPLMNGGNGLGGGAQGAATEGRPYNGDENREGPDGL